MLTCYRCLPTLCGWRMRAGPFFLLGNSVDLCIPFFVVPPVEFNRGKLHHPARSPSRARGPVCFLSVGCPTFSICGDAQSEQAIYQLQGHTAHLPVPPHIFKPARVQAALLQGVRMPPKPSPQVWFIAYVSGPDYHHRTLHFDGWLSQRTWMEYQHHRQAYHVPPTRIYGQGSIFNLLKYTRKCPKSQGENAPSLHKFYTNGQGWWRGIITSPPEPHTKEITRLF